MKPGYRPGKKATSSRIARDAVTKAKPVNMKNLKSLDYEEGCAYDQKRMPCREPEQISENNTRRFPRKRR